jgi:hypothetical protein
MRNPALIALSLIAGLLLVTGCGEHKTPLGTLSNHDLNTLGEVSRDMRGFTADYTSLIKSLQGEDVPGSRKAIEGMKTAVGRATSKAATIDADRQRATMQRYLGKMRGVTTAADRLIAYYEKTPNPENAKANQLATRFEKAALAARQADLNLMKDMLKRATPAERKKLQAAFNKANQRFRQAVGNSG